MKRNWLLESLQLPQKRYERYGECNKCGDCCLAEGEDGGVCEYLTEDRKCAIFDDPKRPLKCHLFPEAPQHPFERCSYYFHDKYEQKIVVRGS